MSQERVAGEAHEAAADGGAAVQVLRREAREQQAHHVVVQLLHALQGGGQGLRSLRRRQTPGEGVVALRGR